MSAPSRYRYIKRAGRCCILRTLPRSDHYFDLLIHQDYGRCSQQPGPAGLAAQYVVYFVLCYFTADIGRRFVTSNSRLRGRQLTSFVFFFGESLLLAIITLARMVFIRTLLLLSSAHGHALWLRVPTLSLSSLPTHSRPPRPALSSSTQLLLSSVPDSFPRLVHSITASTPTPTLPLSPFFQQTLARVVFRSRLISCA